MARAGGAVDVVSRFSVFDVGISCDFPVPPGWPLQGDVDVRVEVAPELTRPEGPPVASLPLLNPDGGRGVQVWDAGPVTIVHVESVALFSCSDTLITYRMLRPLPIESLWWQIFGFVFSLWLERRGRRVFHGAAVDVHGTTVGLLGHSGGGKSSLAAALAVRGCRILGDDHLIVSPGAEPVLVGRALPWLKLDPDASRVLGLDPATMPSLHPAVRKRRFDMPKAWQAPGPQPLRRLIVLDRGGAAHCRLQRVTDPAEALRRVLLHSSVPRTAQALGLSGQRFKTVAQLIREVPMEVWSYPDALDDLQNVAAALAESLAGGNA